MWSESVIVYAIVVHLSTGDVQKIYRSPSPSLETPLFAKNGVQSDTGKNPRRDVHIPAGYQFFPPNDVPPSNDNTGYDYNRPQADVPRDDSSGYNYDKPVQDSPGYAYNRPRSDQTRNGNGYSYDKPQSDIPGDSGYSYNRPQADVAQNSNGYKYEKPGNALSDVPSNMRGYNYEPPNNNGEIFSDPVPTTRLPEIIINKSTLKPLYQRPESDPFFQTTSKPVLNYYFYEPANDPTTRRPVFQDPVGSYLPPNSPDILQDPVDNNKVPSGSYLPPNDPTTRRPVFQDPVGSYLPPNSPEILQDPVDNSKVPSGAYLPLPDPPILQDFFPDRPVPSYLPPNDILTVSVPDFQNPALFQDPTSNVPANSYLPIGNDPPSNSYVPPASSYIPPTDIQRDEIPNDTYLPPNQNYLPPADDPPRDDRKYLPPKTNMLFRTKNNRQRTNNALQIQIVNMSCMQTPTRNYFRTTLRTSRPLDNPPIVENSPTKQCVSIRSDSLYNIDLSGLGRMSDCGIRDCTNGERNGRTHMCAKIRFPTVQGLKLPEDVLLTLQCKAQDRIVSQTKYLTVNPREIQGRSAQTAIAAGGRQQDFTTNVALMRRSSDGGEFNTVVRSGGAVLLGEELMLRANVKQGDGWRYSRFADVTMHRVSSGDRISKHAVTLLDQNGCRNPHMRSVCPSQQAQDRANPLASHFPLRAFIFQDMSSGDEMILSVRLMGCLEYGDCFSVNRRSRPR